MNSNLIDIIIILLIGIFISNINAQQNIIQSKIVCMCDLELDSFVSISCPRNSRIQITNAITYDDENHDIFNNCSYISTYNVKFVIRELMEKKCNGFRNCTFQHLIVHSIGNYNYTCESANFEWVCISYTNDGYATNTPEYINSTWSMGFTYFFYIVTLVLSTSCIVVGSVFLVRRFVIMRRRARGSASSNRTNRGSLYRFWIRYQNDNQNGNVVSEDARPPPSYDNIYTTSTDVNPLPSYSVAVQLKSIDSQENKNNSQQIINQNTTMNIAQQPAINQEDSMININNTHNIIDSNNSSILNGEINLAFINEDPIVLSTNNLNNSNSNPRT